MTTPHAKPRLFYDCPLKAAFMAKYFGMKFERSDGDLLLDWDDMEDDLATCIASGSWEDWYVIHPDSLHLLEPMVGDMITSSAWETGVARLVSNDVRLKLSAELPMVRIIQRGGAVFHWPEREAA